MTLVEAVQGTIHRLHDSPRTGEAYVHSTRAFIWFHGRRHPREKGAAEVTAFLNSLAQEHHTSASTQNQALCAIVFLYWRVLQMDLPDLEGLERAKRPDHLPEVLSRPEVVALPACLTPPFRLMGHLLYGSGLRLLECLCLRVKDVDFERRQIVVRRGKGEHDRMALFPTSARDQLREPTLLGHKDVRTTMIYTHVLDRGPLGVISPLDR